MENQNSAPSFKIINNIKWAYLKRGTGRNILCREHEYNLYKLIETKAKVNFHSLYLQKQVMGLSSSIGGMNNLMSRFTALKRKIKLEGGEIRYEMCGGDILLTGISIDWNYRSAQNGMGLYSVDFNRILNITSKKTITTQHAAVNGSIDKIENAAKLMPRFINHGYPKEQLNSDAKYTLFYNPHNGSMDADWKSIQDSTGILGGSHAARQLAAIIELTAKENREVNWTLHERGSAIFKQALRLVSTSPQYNYSKQKVFYANPVINLELMDQHRKRVGMQLSEKGFVTNEYSIHQGLVAGNWVSEAAILWQMGNKGGAISKGASNITKVAGVSYALPALFGAAPWVMGMIAVIGTNFFARYSNQGIIENTGDALNHYFFKRS